MKQTSPDAPPDGYIICRVLSGDVNAFELLVERYRTQVFYTVAKHVPSENVEEVANDSFTRAYQSLSGYAEKSPFGPWLRKITLRSCCDFWRSRHRNREMPLSCITDEHQEWLDSVLTADSVEAFHRESQRREAEEVLKCVLDHLLPEDRMVLTLVHMEGVSVREAAETLGWSLVKTKVRAHRSRKELRKIISRLIEVRGTK